MKFMDFLREEDGMGTAEVVVIAAVLVALALFFKEQIGGFVKQMMENNFSDTDKITIS